MAVNIVPMQGRVQETQDGILNKVKTFAKANCPGMTFVATFAIVDRFGVSMHINLDENSINVTPLVMFSAAVLMRANYLAQKLQNQVEALQNRVSQLEIEKRN